MPQRNLILILIIVVLIVVLGWVFLVGAGTRGQPSVPVPSPTPEAVSPTPVVSPTLEPSPSPETSSNLISVGANGFAPRNITIGRGESVTWMNEDVEDHQVNSAVHPSHLVYPPLNTIGLLKPGERRSLIFPDAGTFRFHDHIFPQFTGSVVVQ